MKEGIIMAIVTLVTNTITYFVTNKYKRKKESFEVTKESSDYYIETNRSLLKEIDERTEQIIDLNNKVILLTQENAELKVQLSTLQVTCDKNTQTIKELQSLVKQLSAQINSN
jgi:hypothetical protein